MSAPAPRRRQQGIAMITAILIAALVAALAFSLSARERRWLNAVANRRDLAAAQAAALSAIDLARLTLRDDLRTTQFDHLREPWTLAMPPVAVEDGRVGGRIGELQGRFNLYNLQSGGRVNPGGVAALERLLALRQLPVGWAGKMAAALAARWPPATDAAAGRSASKLLPVANPADLAQLAGLDAEALAALDDWLTVLPEATGINVNFAPPEVLMAVTPGLAARDAERLIARRTRAPFNSPQQFVNELPEALRSAAKSALYTVESQYFLCETAAFFGRVQLRLQALIYRQRGAMPQVVWLARP